MRSRKAAARQRMFALGGVLLLGGIFGFRLVDLQVINAAQYVEAAKGKRAVDITVPALRGDIVDRKGQILATTDERYDVQMSPKNTRIKNGTVQRFNSQTEETETVSFEQVLAEIGAATGQQPSEIKKIIDDALAENPESDFAYVKRSVDLTTLNKLKELDIPWLTFSSVFNRTYPNGAVGGNLIGFVGSENEPQAGIELAQDACLVGVDGSESYERSEDGVRLPGSTVVTEKAVNGGTVHLTIDRDLQWQSQQIVNRTASETGAEWVMAVIMDVKTGELLAVAEDGSVDPNHVAGTPPERRDSRAFLAPYEPGSTFKTITVATLLEEGVATPLTQNLTPARWSPEPNVSFGDATTHGEMQWTLTGILVASSNVGTAMLGTQVSPEKRYEYMQKFGFGVSTQAGLAVEDSGLVAPPGDWDRQTVYNSTFGQGLSATIVQTAGAYQAIANNGVRIPPTLVKKCVRPDGTEEVPAHGERVTVISEKTAKELHRMLENVAVNLENRGFLELPGYRVAGKTGTAEQSDGHGGYRSDYVNSFAGFFPAENPQYVVVTSIAFPQRDGTYKRLLGTWGELASSVIKDYRVTPSNTPFEPYPEEY